MTVESEMSAYRELDRQGRRWRRAAAFATALLALTDAIQAASRHALAHIGTLSLHLGGSTTRLFRYALLIAALTLLSSVHGLLRGKRMAWVLAVGATGASLIGHHLVKADLFGVGAAVVVAAVLLRSTRYFRARPDPVLARQGILWLLLGAIATYTYGVVGLYLLDRQFRRSTSLVESAEQATRLLFLLPTSTIEPITRHGDFFITSVRVMVVVVLIVGTARLLHSVVLGGTQHIQELQDVRCVLDTSATTSLAYFHLLSDKHHLFADDGNAFVSYKVVGSVAVSLGEPVGTNTSCLQAAAAFLERCELNGWLPAFHQVTPDGAELLTKLGLKELKIGEEAIVDVKSFSLSGSHFKNIRSNIAKMERDGWTVVKLPAPIDDATMSRLRVVSDAWLADGGHRERTFTLGRFDEDYLRSTTVLAAFDPSGLIQAFTNVIPSFNSVDGNFDLMRRHPDANSPVMDFLFVNMIRRFAADGLSGMNLGLAPFANISGDSVPDRALRILYDRGGRVFNFAGLRSFKDKWRPRWEPRFLMYRSDTELLPIAVATSRAGELPHADTGRLELASGWIGAAARALVATGRRLPFTVAVSVVLVTLQVVTQLDRDSYDGLRSALTYNWVDITHHWQLHRLVTAIFVQDGHGIRFGILTLIPLLAGSEYVLRSKRTIAAFFMGDLISSVTILLVLRLAAAQGSHVAAHNLVERDGGTSSAMFAAIAAATFGLPATGKTMNRWRRSAIWALTIFLFANAILFHRLFDVQHLVAAGVGVFCCGAASPRCRARLWGRSAGRATHG